MPCEMCGAHSPVAYAMHVESASGFGQGPSMCLSCFTKSGGQFACNLEPPPAPSNTPSRFRRRAVQKQERDMAEKIGGRVQKASGALAFAKSDVVKKGVLRGEMKSTKNASFSLKREYLDKIRSECQGRERPFLALRFVNPSTFATEDEWIMIPIEDWDAKAK